MQSKPKKMKRTLEKNSTKSAKNIADEKIAERNEHEMDIELNDDELMFIPGENPNPKAHENEIIPEENPNPKAHENEIIPEENPNPEPNENEIELKRKNRPGTLRKPPSYIKSDEYYPFDKYAQFKNKDEYYAQTHDGDDQYRTDDVTGHQLYAYKLTDDDILKSFPATKSSGEHLAAMQSDGAFEYPDDYGENSNFVKKYLIDAIGNEIYPYKTGTRNQDYMYDDKGEPIFAYTIDGLPYYATRIENTETIEYPPSFNGSDILIYLNDGRIKYPINKTHEKPIYGHDKNGMPNYKIYEEKQYYGQNSKGDEIYGMMKNTHDEIYAFNYKTQENILAKDSNWDEYYAKDKNKNEFYPENNKLHDQFYARAGTKQICAKNKDGVMFYAKDGNADEYYPREFINNEPYDLNI